MHELQKVSLRLSFHKGTYNERFPDLIRELDRQKNGCPIYTGVLSAYKTACVKVKKTTYYVGNRQYD